MFDIYILTVRIIAIYQVLLLIHVIAGWLRAFNSLPDHRVLRTVTDSLEQICEPPLQWVRRLLPVLGGFDLSPLVVWLGLELVKILLGQILF